MVTINQIFFNYRMKTITHFLAPIGIECVFNDL